MFCQFHLFFLSTRKKGECFCTEWLRRFIVGRKLDRYEMQSVLHDGSRRNRNRTSSVDWEMTHFYFHDALLVAAVMLLSVLGLRIVRRYVNIDRQVRAHDVTSAFFVAVGTLYAVLIAFAIFVV